MTAIDRDMLWAARQNIYLLIRGYNQGRLSKREFHTSANLRFACTGKKQRKFN